MQYSNTTVQVPYTPTATMYEYVSWQANDPLVHYLASDLNFQGTETYNGNRSHDWQNNFDPSAAFAQAEFQPNE